jgi:biopolymer transport protein ExbD
VSLQANQRGARRLRRARGGLIEMTPLIDIVFQLLIFFLLTATFQDQSSLDVELARAKNQEKTKEQQAVIVRLGTIAHELRKPSRARPTFRAAARG